MPAQPNQGECHRKLVSKEADLILQIVVWRTWIVWPPGFTVVQENLAHSGLTGLEMWNKSDHRRTIFGWDSSLCRRNVEYRRLLDLLFIPNYVRMVVNPPTVLYEDNSIEFMRIQPQCYRMQ